MKPPPDQTRRRFLTGSIAAAATTLTGTLATDAAAIARAEALRAVDRPVAHILTSYGTPRNVVTEGALTRIDIAVTDLDQHLASFEKLTHVSDRVHVANDTVTFDRNNTTYTIHNHLPRLRSPISNGANRLT